MVKLEGYSKVAVVKYGAYPYHFAIYDDGNDYQVGDMVVLSGGSTPGKISEILTLEEAIERERRNKNITA